MRRRDFINLVGAAAASPLAARAQQPAMPVIGFLHSGSAGAFVPFVAAFRAGLKEQGYIEGENVAIEYRWAENQYDRLPAMADELVRRPVAAIYAGGSVMAAKAATATIPIVFTTGEDPVKTGLVASLSRPGANVTGVSLFYVELGAKRLELLREILPKVEIVGLLVNPKSAQGTVGASSEADDQEKDARAATNASGKQLVVVNARTESDLEGAFANLVAQRVDALMVASDPFLFSQRNRLVALAASHAIPTVYPWRDATLAGGLMSYGTVLTDGYRQAGIYIGRILKGDKPAELPVVQPTKFAFTINLKTANALGLKVPLTLQVAADEVIE